MTTLGQSEFPVLEDSYGGNSAWESGYGVPQWYGSAEDEDEEELEYVCDICGEPAAYNFQDSTLRFTIKDDDFVGRPKYSEYSGDNQNDFYCEKHAKQYEGSDFYAENVYDAQGISKTLEEAAPVSLKKPALMAALGLVAGIWMARR